MDIKLLDLNVSVSDKLVLQDFNLHIKKGEVHVIMGPNGVGKSSLSKLIMGSPLYKINKGDILVDSKSLKNLTTDEIAKLGIFLSFQNPIEVEGITNSEFLRTAMNTKDEQIGLFDFITSLEQSINDLSMEKEMMHRSINVNFSGGEKKKNEILQMKLLKPKFIILDELDSGLDIDALNIVSKNINQYLKENSDTSVLLITHYPRILNFIKPDFIHVLIDGKIKETGDINLAMEIEKNGYKNYNSSTSLLSEK